MIIKNQKLDYTSDFNTKVNNDVLLFTGNKIIKSNNRLVMGAGVAKIVRDNYKNCDKLFAQKIKGNPNTLLEFVKVTNEKCVGWIPVKHHYKDNADTKLIYEAFKNLANFAKRNPQLKIHCNYPAVGKGKLHFNDVQEILINCNLPDNVILYKSD